MWEELEIAIKLNKKCNVENNKSMLFMGQGKIEKPDIMVIFDHPSQDMLEKKSIIDSNEYNILKPIFDYVKIDLNNCYFTTLVKYYNNNIVKDEQRDASMGYLLEEIYLLDPKNILCIGEDLFNYLYKYYTKKNDLYNKDKLLVNIHKNVGDMFNFYDIPLIALCEVDKIKKLNRDIKNKLVNSLKGRNK